LQSPLFDLLIKFFGPNKIFNKNPKCANDDAAKSIAALKNENSLAVNDVKD
jgi:hypothetical protein